MPRREPGAAGLRHWIAQGFTRVEDVVYVGLGVLLAVGALALLVEGAYDFVSTLLGGGLSTRIISLLDRILLVLMIVEVLYTVQVSFREHALIPEPFLVIGLIAGTRRLLVLVAELGELMTKGEAAFRNAMLELALLSGMILSLVGALVLLRRRATQATADRA